MASTVFRCLGLLVVLAILSCPEAAPSTNKEDAARQEQLVRVYPINEEQYDRLVKLTNGNNLISEARLTSAGFTSVRNTLDSGWNSLLRIMGLTTTVRSDVAKLDIDGQPLCVMKKSLSDNEEARAETDDTDDSVISCIVVLRKDPLMDVQAISTNADFAPYWYQGNNAATAQQLLQHTIPLEPQATQQVVEPMPAPAPEDDQEEEQATALKLTKPKPKSRSKPKSKSRSKSKSKSRSKPKQQIQKDRTRFVLSTPVDEPTSRQYGSIYGAPSPYEGGYGSPFGGAYPYGGYGQSPYDAYNQYNPYASYGQQSYYPTQQPYYPTQQPYYPAQQPFYGAPSPYSPFNPYYEQNEEEDDDDEDEQDGYAEEEEDEDENEYY